MIKKTLRQQWAISIGLLMLTGIQVGAQQTQDNWYVERSLPKTSPSHTATNGGFSLPKGMAVGPDGRIYVAAEGYGCIQVYQRDGTYSFSITNGFGAAQSFSQPRGMITDSGGNLFIADYGNDCVYKFTADGAYVRTFGSGSGSGDGQLNGVIDVAVAPDGQVYALEHGNHRLSVFNADGSFDKVLLRSGTLDGQLSWPASIAISDSGKIYISPNFVNARSGAGWQNQFPSGVKVFDTNGVFQFRFEPASIVVGCSCANYFGAASIRFDRMGLLHALISWSSTVAGGGCETCTIVNMGVDVSTKCKVFTGDGSLVTTYGFGLPTNSSYGVTWPCHGIAPDGTAILADGGYSSSLILCRYGLREQAAVPHNAAPMPTVIQTRQRTSSPLVDVDFKVTDMDDTNVFVGVLIFTTNSATPSLSACLRNPTMVEGTSTNLGADVAANQVHRLTWNPGADWSVNLGNYRIALLAKDSRTNLLDIHYLDLPAGNGMPALKISRSPLTTNDFMQVWWWQLATNDPGIILASNQIFGVSGPFANKQLCDNGVTTADGRDYLYTKLNVREATTQEVQWAKQGNMPIGNAPNQRTPVRVVGGRPKAVNEWGFDSGAWDINTCKWIVPLN